ncbi:hypothetical protein [Flavobacterium sp. 3HN19-14]|uniref:hypothetical protein n=1 Tax=Flavobacterium sp. 3HN19-14 TaxID=3448133 RepID=UPI003EDF2FC8
MNKSSENYGVGNDFWIIKLNGKGEVEWDKSFGGDKDDQLFALKQTYDKGYIIGGNSASSTTGNKSKTNRNGTDIWVIKLSEDGQIDWQETYDFGKVDVLTSLVENHGHSFLVGGYADTDSGDGDYIAMKISEKGEKLWDRTVGSKGDDVLRKVIETRDGGYLMAGTSNPESENKSKKSSKKGIVKNNIQNGNIAAADKLNDTVGGNVKEAKDKANGFVNEKTQKLTDGFNEKTKNDSPLKMSAGDISNPLDAKKAQTATCLMV